MSFSKKVQEARMSYTFDDFLLTPNASYVEPKDIDTRIELGKGIKLNIPVLSAAMDTVTEADLAIAIAQEGGVGVIHRNITLERQVEEVKKVKNAEDLTIRDVVTITPDSTIADVQTKMQDELISGLPVVDGDKIIGIISKRDIRPVLKSEPNKTVKDIMTSDVVTVEEGVSAEEALNIARSNLGYFAGYYDRKTYDRINKAYGAIHPVFKTNPFDIAPEEAYRIGLEMGKAM